VPPGPNHSNHTRRTVAYDGTATSTPCRSATYWAIGRYRLAMLIRDRCSISRRTAKIASRTGSLIVGCPPEARSQCPSTQPSIPCRRQAAAHRCNVRTLACDNPSTAASCRPNAASSATFAARRAANVVHPGSYPGCGSPAAARSALPLRKPVSASCTCANRSRTISRC
jgi:hypothetical protein